MKKTFTMTREEYETILLASRPVTYIVVGGHEPSDPLENAKRAWQALAAKHGFIWDTVTADPDSTNEMDFQAEVADPK